jgi:histidinol-phosphate aminotransferase
MPKHHQANSMALQTPPLAPRQHGGPDAVGVPRFDFSTNSNACGPCPAALAAVQNADATRYPDAGYSGLKQQLADFHGVDVARVVLAGSASEFIFRITAWVAQHTAGQGRVHLPPHSYGDYAHAAQACGLAPTAQVNAAQLVWACEPSSPLGQAHGVWPDGLDHARQLSQNRAEQASSADPTVPLIPAADRSAGAQLVLDCAYAPLRLSGAPTLNAGQLAQVWQLFSPNKALGLTGVRAAYAIAPLGADTAVLALERLSASWPIGAHGVAMLQAWVQPGVQAWLTQSLLTLATWKVRQVQALQQRGWTCLPSDANFFCARPLVGDLAADLHRLRTQHGIKLRDTTSFGLPGHVRLGVLPPEAQDALETALCVSN